MKTLKLLEMFWFADMEKIVKTTKKNPSPSHLICKDSDQSSKCCCS